jgi:hypothetical protein
MLGPGTLAEVARPPAQRRPCLEPMAGSSRASIRVPFAATIERKVAIYVARTDSNRIPSQPFHGGPDWVPTHASAALQQATGQSQLMIGPPLSANDLGDSGQAPRCRADARECSPDA